MILLRLLELEEEATPWLGRPRLPHERFSFRQSGELLLDLPFDVFGVELAGGDDEDVGGRVGASVEVLESIVVDPADRLGRPDNRAAERVLVEDQRREVLVGQLVWPVLIHLDLLDDDLPLSLEINERRP